MCHIALRTILILVFPLVLVVALDPDTVLADADAERGPGGEVSGAQDAEGSVSGQVLRAGDRSPLPGAWVRVVGHAERVTTSDDGRFTLSRLSPGAYRVEVGLSGYQSQTTPIILTRSGRLELLVLLEPAPTEPNTVVVTEAREATEELRYSVYPDTDASLAGALGDPLRIVQNLPGVARPPFGLGDLIVRGAAPSESGYFLEGAPLPLIYHFLGVTSTIGPDLVERIDYLPGGYGARYGRLMGGIVNLELQSELPRKPRGYADIDLLDGSVHAQGGWGVVAVAAHARASYLEHVLGPILTEPAVAAGLGGYQVRIPRYRDAQLRAQVRLGPQTMLTGTLVASDDTGAVYSAGSEDLEMPEAEDAIAEYNARYIRGMVRLRQQPGPQLSHQLSVAFGPNEEYFKVGAALLEYNPSLISVRDEWNGRMGGSAGLPGLQAPWRWQVGLDLELIRYSLFVDLPGSDQDTAMRLEDRGVSPSPYLELELSPLPGLSLQPGLRVDPLIVPGQDYAAWSVDPRLSARYRPRTGAREGNLELSASLGRYSQFPDPSEFFAEVGNNRLRPSSAIQSAVGTRWFAPPYWILEATAYFNRLFDLPYRPETAPIPIEDYVLGMAEGTELVEALRVENGGEGRNTGLEVMLRLQPTAPVHGWIAYTWSRSERRSPASPGWVPFDYDQPHLLTLVGAARLPRAWSASLRFRVASGSPYTPPGNRLLNADTGGFTGLFDPIAGPGSARLKLFHQLDARVERQWQRPHVRWTVSLELQNVYNRQNVEAFYYNYDYSGIVAVYGLPILPVLGLKGAW